jgi:hypothetical protein
MNKRLLCFKNKEMTNEKKKAVAWRMNKAARYMTSRD